MRDDVPADAPHSQCAALEPTLSHTSLSPSHSPPKVSRRDWILLPVISLLTLLAFALAGRFAARRLYWTVGTSSNSCMVLDDRSTGVRGMPNTACMGKYYEEAKAVEYRFNRCGHRAGFECGAKEPGVYRIVMVGSSYAEGANVSREQSISALLGPELTQLTGREVEVYNEGLHWKSPRTIGLDFERGAIQSEQPDMILWLVTPWDIENADFLLPKQEWLKGKQERAAIQAGGDASKPDTKPASLIEKLSQQSFDRLTGLVVRHTRYWFTHEPAPLLLQHYLYLSQSIYLSHYLEGGETTDFLQVPRTPAFLNDLVDFDRHFAEAMVAERAASRQADGTSEGDVPVVVTLLPQRGQAVMIVRNDWPKGYDPYQLGREVNDIARKHGATYVDLLNTFRGVPRPELDYLPNDGHPTAEGYRIFSVLLADRLGQVIATENAKTRLK